MKFDEYQEAALATAFYPRGLTYPALKLCGEAGEVAEKIGKYFRDGGDMTDLRAGLLKELGDVLWYISALSNELGFNLSEVAEANIEKLKGRAVRGTLGGSGDDR